MKKPKQKVITFIIETDLDEAVEAIARKKKTFKTAVLNDAIRAYIVKPEAK